MGATLSNEEICQMVHPTRDEAIFPRNRSLFGGAGAGAGARVRTRARSTFQLVDHLEG